MELFYDNLKPERNNEETLTIQTDREFNQNEIKKVNEKYDVNTFSTST